MYRLLIENIPWFSDFWGWLPSHFQGVLISGSLPLWWPPGHLWGGGGDQGRWWLLGHFWGDDLWVTYGWVVTRGVVTSESLLGGDLQVTSRGVVTSGSLPWGWTPGHFWGWWWGVVTSRSLLGGDLRVTLGGGVVTMGWDQVWGGGWWPGLTRGAGGNQVWPGEVVTRSDQVGWWPGEVVTMWPIPWCIWCQLAPCPKVVLYREMPVKNITLTHFAMWAVNIITLQRGTKTEKLPLELMLTKEVSFYELINLSNLINLMKGYQ